MTEKPRVARIRYGTMIVPARPVHYRTVATTPDGAEIQEPVSREDYVATPEGAEAVRQIEAEIGRRLDEALAALERAAFMGALRPAPPTGAGAGGDREKLLPG